MGNAATKRVSVRDTKLANIHGVGPVALARLAVVGIDTAEQLVGYYLFLGRDAGKMRAWLRSECGIHPSYARRIVRALARMA